MNDNLETPQDTSDLQSWSMAHADPAPMPGPIGRQAEHLCRSCGIEPPASLMLSALLLAAVSGPSRRVYASPGCRLPPALNLVFVTRAPVVLQAAARELFEPLATAIGTTMRITGLIDRNWLRETCTQLRLELLQAQDVIDGIAPRPTREVKINEEITAKVAEYEAQFLRKTAAEKQPMLYSELARFEFKQRPEVLVEALEAGELLDADMSFDAAVMNQSYAGETLRSLLHAPATQLLQIARVLNASWRGLTAVGSNRPRGAQISNLWITDHDTLAQALESEIIRESGVLNTFVFVETEALEVQPEADNSGDGDAWFRVLNGLFHSRRGGGVSEYQLGAEATAVFRKFLNDVNAEWPGLPADVRPFAACWPEIALKLSLLLHLGAHDPQPCETAGGQPAPPQPAPAEIEAKTLRAAVQLIKQFVAGHVRLMAQLCPSQPNAGDPEVERMVRKIRVKQPVTRVNLFRSYAKQSRALHDPVLARAISCGRVRVDGCFLYAADASSVLQHPQSVSASSATDISGSQPEDSSQEGAR